MAVGWLGCIAGPVASGLVHPFGGGVLMQAEEGGADSVGELGGEVEESSKLRSRCFTRPRRPTTSALP